MSRASPFQKNLNFYSKTSPQVAIRLPYANTDHLVLFRNPNGEINLSFKDYHYHSKEGALQEAENWFSSLELKGKEILYVYGIGLGYYYEAAKRWLKEKRDRRLIFLENDPAVICRFFETEKASLLLHDKQVQLHFFQDFEKDQMVFEKLAWSFIKQPLAVSALTLYADIHKDWLTQLEHKIPYDAAVYTELIDEYLIYGAPFYKNYYKNLLELPESYQGNRLFGKFKKIPAIICGAGPSLKKQLPLLKSLGDRALIFSGGSSLNALSHGGILPHFGAGVDPNEEQYRRLLSSNSLEVPFFYRSRMNHQAFKLIKGPRLYLTGSGGYETATWFDKKLGLRGKNLDEGHNVINLCVEVAHALGCSPIIFVGMDLAFTNRQTYSSGVVEDASLDNNQWEMDRAFLKKNIYGEEVFTCWKWIAESDWIGKFAKEHPRAKLINATEGGIGFPEVPNIPFEEVSKKYLKEPYNLHEMVQSEIQKNALKKIDRKKIVKLITKLSKSLKRCMKYFETLLDEEKKVQIFLKVNKEVDVPPQTATTALLENEIVLEPAYEYVLDVFNQMYGRANFRDTVAFQALKEKASQAKVELKRIELNQKRYQFLQFTAAVNDQFIKEALEGE